MIVVLDYSLSPKPRNVQNNVSLRSARRQARAEQGKGEAVLSREVQCHSDQPTAQHPHVHSCSLEHPPECPCSCTKGMRGGYLSLLHPLLLTQL